MTRAGAVVFGASLGLMGLWAAGLFTEDAARVVFVIGVVALVAAVRSGVEVTPPRWALPALGACLVTLPLIVFAHGWSRVLAGRMGVDFAIFTQCVHGIASHGVPMTSLLGESPVNFFTHHFAPILFVPGALSWLGVAPPLALLLAQSVAFAAALAGLFVAGRRLGLSALSSAWWTLVVGLCPNVRPEVLWGVHDEVLSVPFVIWAFVALVAKRPVLSMVLVLLAATGKESYFALAPLWLIIVWRWNRPSARALLACAGLAVVGVAGGALYVFGQPLWAGKAFDHYGKLAPSFSLLVATSGARLGFLASFFGWFAFLPLLSARARLVALAALPFLALGLVAEDPEMYRFTGYHSIVPQLVLGLAGAVALAEGRVGLLAKAPAFSMALLLSLQLAWSARSLWKPAREALARRWYPAPELSHVPRAGRVAVDPAAALVLLEHEVVRVFTAEDRGSPVTHVVARPEGWELPGPNLTRDHAPCELAPGWVTLCPKRE